MSLKIGFVYPATESLAIELLSAGLKNEGYQTTLYFDPSLFYDELLNIRFLARFFSFKEKLLDEICRDEPDVIAFSLVTDLIPWFKSIASEIRRRCPHSFIIAGGIHITSSPREILETGLVDAIIIGEGDEAIIELVQGFERGKIKTNMPNLGIIKGSDMIINPPRPLIEDLDSLPFADKSIYDHTSFRADHIFSLIASRGCPYDCTYCNNSLMHLLYENKSRKIRLRSVDNVIKEIKLGEKKYKFKAVNFSDEIFGANLSWLEEFADKYAREINLPYICCLHPHFVDERRIALLEKSGCVKVEVGMQSVSKRLREEILQRAESFDQAKKAVDLLVRSRITACVQNIINLPTESEEDLLEMVNYYNENRPDQFEIFSLRYYPRTKIVDLALKAGTLDHRDIERINRGEDFEMFTHSGTKPPKITQKIRLLIILSNILPSFMVNFIVRKKWYKYFPITGLSAFVHFLWWTFNLKRVSETDKAKLKRRFYHYLFYFRKKVEMIYNRFL